MIAPAVSSLQRDLEDAYREGADEALIGRCLREAAELGDDELVEFICTDAALRDQKGLAVTLARYLGQVPDLSGRLIPLDAAIDCVLQRLGEAGIIDPAQVDALARRHPELDVVIRDAAALRAAICSTDSLRGRLLGWVPEAYPTDFGPIGVDGVRRYELRSLLGTGSFGNVFLGLDRMMSEPGHEALVAVKVRHETIRSGSRSSLLREAAAARRVRHPNCVQVFDVGISDDHRPFVVYEYVRGQTLHSWFAQRAPGTGTRELIQVMVQIARGVHAAHASGLIHCDLKPDNILIEEDGTARVTDFGIARRIDESAAGIAPAGTGVSGHEFGNAAFVAPEQADRQEEVISTASDIYALGALLFWMLSGRFLSSAAAQEQLRQMLDSRRAREELSVHGDWDLDLCSIIHRATELLPDHRHSSAAAFADDLVAWLEHRPLGWTRTKWPRRVRLFVCRRPRVSVGLVLGLGVLIGVLWMGYNWIETRSRVRAQADASRSLANKARYLLKTVPEYEVRSDLLQAFWIIEAVDGSGLLMDPIDDGEMISKARIDIASRMVQRAEAAGRGSDVVTLMWKTGHLFWMLGSKVVQPEAEPFAAILVAEWRQTVSAQDSMIAVAEALHHVAIIKRIFHQAYAQGPLTESMRSELLASKSVLEALEPRRDIMKRGSAVHHLVMRSLRNCYNPALLNDLDCWHALNDEIKTLGQSSPAVGTPSFGDDRSPDRSARSEGGLPGRP